MILINDLNILYNNLSDIKCDMFCKDKDYLREHKLIEKIICDFFDKNISIPMKHDHNNCDCFSLIDLLIGTISSIEKYSCCNKHHGYLLQISRLECILKNIDKLLCQLKCFPTKDCDLLAKTLCLLFEILELLANIIIKIKNLECLCNSRFDCKCEIFECLLRLLIEDINDLEDRISDLAQVVLKITSLNIINCTASTVAPHHIPRDRSYMMDCDCDCCCNRHCDCDCDCKCDCDCDCCCNCECCKLKHMNPYR